MAADTLRDRLRRLVEEWREDIKHVLMSAEDYSPRDYAECRAIKGCADQLAAILAESEEPKRCRQCDGILSTPTCGLCAGQTHYVGDDCPGGHAEEPAKLPLGHPFMTAVDVLGRKSKSSDEFCPLCGQPRSAHEPLPTPTPAPPPAPKL